MLLATYMAHVEHFSQYPIIIGNSTTLFLEVRETLNWYIQMGKDQLSN